MTDYGLIHVLQVIQAILKYNKVPAVLLLRFGTVVRGC
jgi:hypothetical protein